MGRRGWGPFSPSARQPFPKQFFQKCLGGGPGGHLEISFGICSFLANARQAQGLSQTTLRIPRTDEAKCALHDRICNTCIICK